MSDIPILHKTEEPKNDNNETADSLAKVSNQIGFLSGAIKDAGEVTSKATTLVTDTFLGDVSFITKPMKELGSIGAKIGGFFKPKKTKPKKSSLLKEGTVEGASAVYLGEILKKDSGDKKGEDLLKGFEGIMPMLLGGAGVEGIKTLLKPLIPKLMMGGGIAMIAGSIIWMAIDGIRGAFKSKDWGVSKVSGAIGGIFGGMGSGISGAFKNMGKWALLGAGIGLVGGPVGVLAGGLIGAAVGGILGFIGGERIAKATQAVGEWFVKNWSKITGFFVNAFTTIKDGVLKVFHSPLMQQAITFVKDTFTAIFDFIKTPFIKVYDSIMDSVDKIKAIFSSDDSLGKKIGKLLVEVVIFVPKMMLSWITGIWDSVKGLFLDLFTDQKQADGKVKKGLIKQYLGLLINVGKWIGDTFLKIIRGIGSGLGSIGTFIKDSVIKGFQILPDVIEKAFDFLAGVWSGIKEKLQAIPVVGDIFNFFDKHIFQPLGKIFTDIKDGIVNLIKDPIGYGKKILQDLLDSVKEIFVKVKEGFLTFLADPLGTAKDAVSNVGEKVGDVAGNAWSSFKGLFGGKEPTVVGGVHDGIIKPDGSIIQTDPSDTLIASKNPIGFADKEVSNSSRGNEDSLMTQIINLLEQLSKQSPNSNQNNVLTNNYTSRYNPLSIMTNLTAEVF